MSVNTLPSTTASLPAFPSSGSVQQGNQNSLNVSSLKPFQVIPTPGLHAFASGKYAVRALSATEHGRVMQALQTSVAWLNKAITTLQSPSSWSSQTRKLLSSLFPGGLQTPAERNALQAQLTHTLGGVKKCIDSDASTIASAELENFATLVRTAESTRLKNLADPSHPNRSNEMHISSKWLREATDTDLAGTVTHEASHIYANTDDNWYTLKCDGQSQGFYNDTTETTSKPHDFTFTNAVNNAGTVQLATEVLAGVSFDAMQ
jgi:hypothetical protein